MVDEKFKSTFMLFANQLHRQTFLNPENGAKMWKPGNIFCSKAMFSIIYIILRILQCASSEDNFNQQILLVSLRPAKYYDVM